MTFRKLLSLFAVGTTLAVTGAATAETKGPNACFADHRLGPINEYTRDVPMSHDYEKQLAGAQVFVYAEPGLTAEWLYRTLEQRRTSGSSSSCPQDIAGASINVQSGGPGFWVTISSTDVPTAKEIVARAKRMVQR
jgi:hypothetical protein